MGNKGALIRFNGANMKPKFVQFTAVVSHIYNILGTPQRTPDEVRQPLDVLLINKSNNSFLLIRFVNCSIYYFNSFLTSYILLFKCNM